MTKRPLLKCFRELRITEPTYTKDSTTSTYRFTDRDGARHEVELHYKYDRPVFEAIRSPAGLDWRSRNHARMLHSIASLNYGLFCERIAFDFPLTKEDLAYHRAMQDVTAREQYLTRFVRDEPHILILPEYHVRPAEFDPEAVRDLAEFECEIEEPQGEAWTPSPERFGVLSSGGKESLLSYGLLRELGKEVYPLYINESGRHWHTAVMAHRHHALVEARTRRIWTSVDRLYVAVNRMLPFVRKDFQRVEADVYPIQLFTFNSYQMAALALCRHERIGTLVMGNEFDEGPWPEVNGVRHYWGIYDQSQEFDGLASAYYASKGWGVAQTSLVRSASSLVIQDLLASRYPDLAAIQTSCHATHTVTTSDPTTGAPRPVAHPCGRCSKCLGVLLFLLAGGHDATRLRYTPADVAALAGRIKRTHIKVDQAEAEHALWLAQQRGALMFEGSKNGFVPTPHAEVEALRFDENMSRSDNLPEPLASEIYGLLRKRATGVLRKRDGVWVPG